MKQTEPAAALSPLSQLLPVRRQLTVRTLSPAMEQVLAVPNPPPAEAADVHAQLIAHLSRSLPLSAELLSTELQRRFGAAYQQQVLGLLANLQR